MLNNWIKNYWKMYNRRSICLSDSEFDLLESYVNKISSFNRGRSQSLVSEKRDSFF